ncbi:hypothetical protein KSC_044320 [Ktedonobacter sp. SOSP1-52]|uniref:hypothetical protein n=1 Tax=Ktedonobacter sp. SOSP1-52 TaxID=2778366 RepID=UPI001916A257|nr:hypothetical protein [Ktedonobacter sp. SOSP1-52]GHO65540.1 hypothetical protein KSC_044320 [Ktedonobacter sp. SOSP1-52]
MSERQAKRQRRAEKRAAATHEAITAHPPLDASPHPTRQPSVASSHLAIALSAAVPLRVLALYERQGPDEKDLEAACKVGALLASKGDVLLFRSQVKGETAAVFNQTAQALAVLSFAPDGVTCFGHHFDAQNILSGFFGVEAAKRYCQQVTGTPLAAQQEKNTTHDGNEH